MRVNRRSVDAWNRLQDLAVRPVEGARVERGRAAGAMHVIVCAVVQIDWCDVVATGGGLVRRPDKCEADAVVIVVIAVAGIWSGRQAACW